MINYHNSYSHRLPPELLGAVASHLNDDKSLVVATHVCHHWRISLLASPCLWSHLDLANQKRALVFLERSKSAPLSVDLVGVNRPSEVVKQSLKDITTRVITLWAVHDPFLDQLLAQPVPMLKTLEITEFDVAPTKPVQCLPSLTSLVVHGSNSLRFHAPLLTSFHITYKSGDSPRWEWAAQTLLDFFRSCPLLEVAFLSCGILDTHPDSGEVVSLPLLRSFTHESTGDRYQLHLFDQLSLPSTCRVVLMIDVTKHGSDPWIPTLPTPRDPSYLSDIKTIKVVAPSCHRTIHEDHVTFRTEFANSARRAVSFDRTSYYGDYPYFFSSRGFLDVFGSIAAGPVETLCFQCYPVRTLYALPQVTPEEIKQGMRKFRNLKTMILVECDTDLSLDGLSSCPTVDTLVIHSMDGPHIVRRVEEFAVSRKKAGSPLRVLTLVFPSEEPYPFELERLTDCVGRVEVLRGSDAICWDVNEYLLGASTNEEGASRP